MGTIIQDSNIRTDPVMVVFQKPDTSWLMWPVIARDLLRPLQGIDDDIKHLDRQHTLSSHQKIRLGMKQAVWYLMTGQS